MFFLSLQCGMRCALPRLRIHIIQTTLKRIFVFDLKGNPFMTLTISQLQHMYGTNSVQTLRGANPYAAPQNAAVGVLEPNAASNEIIPDEDNPLFMSVEQRAWVHQRDEVWKRQEESKLAMAEHARQREEHARQSEAFQKERAMIAAMSPEEKLAYSEQQQQQWVADAIRYRIEREAKIEKLKASLPPRIEGALGDDLRLTGAYTIDQANFLEEMKVKYAHVKNAISSSDEVIKEFAVRNAVGDFMLDPEQVKEQQRLYGLSAAEVAAEFKQRLGNSFVVSLAPTFSHIAHGLNKIYNNQSIMADAQARLAAGSDHPMLREQIASHEKSIAEAKKELRDILVPLHEKIDSFRVWHEVRSFFADYAEFAYGEPYDFYQAYREADLHLPFTSN
jgi:hypothetical protein